MEERLTACEHAIIELTKRLNKLEKHKISEGRNLADKEYIKYLKQQFSYIDIDNEIKKMQTWLSLSKNKNRKLTRKFMVAWLNKIDVPIQTEKPADRAIFLCKKCSVKEGKQVWHRYDEGCPFGKDA